MVPRVALAPRGRSRVFAPARALEESVETRLFSPARWRQLAEHLDLSPRQSEIAQLICEGHAYKAIAERAGISINTVRMHMRALFPKLGAHDRLSIVLRMIAADRLLRRQARFRAPAT